MGQFCSNVFRTFDVDGNGVIDFKVFWDSVREVFLGAFLIVKVL